MSLVVGKAISEQSHRINRILRNVNAAVMNHSKLVDVGEKFITEYGYYRYSNPGPVTLNKLQLHLRLWALPLFKKVLIG